MIDDLASLAADLTRLLKAGELDKAFKLSSDARRLARVVTLEARQLGVHEATIGLVEARRLREKILRQADEQPEAQRAFARAQLERICRELFDERIAVLQTRKRELSHPRRAVATKPGGFPLEMKGSGNA